MCKSKTFKMYIVTFFYYSEYVVYHLYKSIYFMFVIMKSKNLFIIYTPVHHRTQLEDFQNVSKLMHHPILHTDNILSWSLIVGKIIHDSDSVTEFIKWRKQYLKIGTAMSICMKLVCSIVRQSIVNNYLIS